MIAFDYLVPQILFCQKLFHYLVLIKGATSVNSLKI